MPSFALRAALLLLALVPLATATWTVPLGGPPEPSDPTDAAWMWSGPPQTPGQTRIYMNGWKVGDSGYAAAPATVRVHAILGYWLDCNKDGIVGGPAGTGRYPAALLLDRSLCPVEPLGGPRHNDGTWVTELLTLAPSGGTYANAGAKVWAGTGAASGAPLAVLSYDATLGQWTSGPVLVAGKVGFFADLSNDATPRGLPYNALPTTAGGLANGMTYRLRDTDA